MSRAGNLLHEKNPCGQTLLRLVSRGSSIIAELLRLSKNVPDVFLGASFVRDPSQLKYVPVLFDFQYLKDPEPFEQHINGNTELLDLEDEFQENMADLLERFYQLYDAIFKYISDFNRFLEDLISGYFVQYTVDGLLLDTDGKQLMCEAIYLMGVMLLMLDEKIPGPAREKMIIAFYRSKGESTMNNVDEVCKLCRATGYIPAHLNGGEQISPQGYPENFFARFPIPAEVVRMVIGKLQSDDIYLQEEAFPSPDHRSTRLANQASMLYTILYFAPKILNEEMPAMREMVDKHFNDNFIITSYMGQVVDLSEEWHRYPAAHRALQNTLTVDNILLVNQRKMAQVDMSLQELRHYLNEGVLTEQFVLDNIVPLQNCIRKANVTIRWLMLHRRVRDVGIMRKFREAIVTNGVSAEAMMHLLLNTAQLEFQLKTTFGKLLASKQDTWNTSKNQCAQRMKELAQYFSGQQALTRVERDEQLMSWFEQMASQIDALDYQDAILAGRKIQQLTTALEEVEQFDQIDTSLQIKQFLADSRQLLTQMVRAVNVRDEVMSIIESVSDLSYAWECINDYVSILHHRIKKAPTSVVLLRAMFLKLASILDIPLVRISQCNSPDTISVAEYYSGELVDFVRKVLAVIPQSVFTILTFIVQIQTHRLRGLPIKLETVHLKDFAQLSERYDLSKATHQVSVFTEGILAMDKTLLGIIQVDPKQVLADGIRTELVRQVSEAMHKLLYFNNSQGTPTQVAELQLNKLASRLEGFRTSFEYIQDYINIYGLRIWQEEFYRIINYNVEQEVNRFLKKQVYDQDSQYQSREIPIPRFPAPKGDLAINFMGRMMNQLIMMTGTDRTIYAPESAGWYTMEGAEVCGLSFFNLLHRAIGVLGMSGLDKILSFLIVYSLTLMKRFWQTQVSLYLPVLERLTAALQPEWRLPENASVLYSAAQKKCQNIMCDMLNFTSQVGQAALLRKQIANELSFSCHLDANLLSCALETMDKSLVNSIRMHYHDKSKHNYPGANGNPILTELTKYLDAAGINDPLSKIYMTSEPLEGLPALMLLVVASYSPNLQYDKNFGSLVRTKAKYPVDGAPMVAGIVTILKQFHPSYTRQFLSLMGQFVRAMIDAAFMKEARITELPIEALNMLLVIEMFCKFAHIPRSEIEGFVPAYIFDAISV